MTRWLLALAVSVLTACGAIPVGSPRTIGQLDVTFSPSLGASGGITREQAIEAARDGGAAMPRPPEITEFGTAVCEESVPQCIIGGGGPRPVWVIEWTRSRGRDFGTWIVDGVTGEVLGGVGGS